MPKIQIRHRTQAGSLLVMVLFVTLFIGLLMVSVLKIQSNSNKDLAIINVESKADKFVSYCYKLADKRLSNIPLNTDTFNLLDQGNEYTQNLKQCKLDKITLDSGSEALSIENCSAGIVDPSAFDYYQLTASVELEGGVKIEGRAIVTENPCINSDSGWQL